MSKYLVTVDHEYYDKLHECDTFKDAVELRDELLKQKRDPDGKYLAVTISEVVERVEITDTEERNHHA